MPPGQYIPDPTEGVTRGEDLPPARTRRRSRNYRHRCCPGCGHSAYRYDVGHRTLHHLGDRSRGFTLDLLVTYSKHRCDHCHYRFGADLTDVAPAGSHYTHQVIAVAVSLVVEDGVLYRTASWHLWRDHRVFVPYATIPNWVEAAGEKAGEWGVSEHLNWALSDFSGYLAVDELYDGPFCVLSAVDGPRQRRVLCEVLDHDPTHDDIRPFLMRLKEAIAAHGGELRGVTTDGSSLCPIPLAEVVPGVPHQVCEFHVLKELTKAILHALAGVRKKLAARAPKVPRGRPRNSAVARRQVRKAKRIKQRVTDFFEDRHLFVRHALTTSQRATLSGLVRGEPILRPCEQSWTKCTACSTAGAAPIRPWPNWSACDGTCDVIDLWVGPWTS